MLRSVILIIIEIIAWLLDKQYQLRVQYLLILMLTDFVGGIPIWGKSANFNKMNFPCFHKEIFRIQFWILRKIFRYFFILTNNLAIIFWNNVIMGVLNQILYLQANVKIDSWNYWLFGRKRNWSPERPLLFFDSLSK